MKIILHRAALFAFSSDPYYNHANFNGLSGGRLPDEFMTVPLRLQLLSEFRQTCGETLLTTWGPDRYRDGRHARPLYRRRIYAWFLGRPHF
jgi:hypothetical protein